MKRRLTFNLTFDQDQNNAGATFVLAAKARVVISYELLDDQGVVLWRSDDETYGDAGATVTFQAPDLLNIEVSA